MKDAPLKNIIYALARISVDRHEVIYETLAISENHIL